METRTAVFRVGEMRPNGDVFTADALAQLARENPLTLKFDGETLWQQGRLMPHQVLEMVVKAR